jgi:3-methylcrotonyl-CoA carboxylase alpha subunit
VGLYVALRDAEGHIAAPNNSSPWSTLASRRFGGDKYRRTISLQTDDEASSTITVEISPSQAHGNKFDVVVNAPSGQHTFSSIPAQLIDPTTLHSQINGRYVRPTIVSQPPPPGLPASASHNSMERVHIFSDGHKTSLVVPSPKWLQSLGSDLLNAHKGGLRAPMPSLVVEVRVKPGDRVEKGQAVIVLESMKTETVLRTDVAGIVKLVGCKNGEMVEEGRELVDIEPEEAVKEE